MSKLREILEELGGDEYLNPSPSKVEKAVADIKALMEEVIGEEVKNEYQGFPDGSGDWFDGYNAHRAECLKRLGEGE